MKTIEAVSYYIGRTLQKLELLDLFTGMTTSIVYKNCIKPDSFLRRLNTDICVSDILDDKK